MKVIIPKSKLDSKLTTRLFFELQNTGIYPEENQTIYSYSFAVIHSLIMIYGKEYIIFILLSKMDKIFVKTAITYYNELALHSNQLEIKF